MADPRIPWLVECMENVLSHHDFLSCPPPPPEPAAEPESSVPRPLEGGMPVFDPDCVAKTAAEPSKSVHDMIVEHGLPMSSSEERQERLDRETGKRIAEEPAAAPEPTVNCRHCGKAIPYTLSRSCTECFAMGTDPRPAEPPPARGGEERGEEAYRPFLLRKAKELLMHHHCFASAMDVASAIDDWHIHAALRAKALEVAEEMKTWRESHIGTERVVNIHLDTISNWAARLRCAAGGGE